MTFWWSFICLWLLALCAALYWAWPRRQRLLGRYRAFRGVASPRYPIVLAHGVLGFDELRVAGRSHTYFRGIAEQLRARGIDVHVVRVNPTAEIKQRAEQLAEQVRRIQAKRVNIIAHSMGGLDARYAIAKLGLADRVASLTTIGTPHRGTPLADHGVAWLGDRLRLRALLGLLKIESSGFYNLTTSHLTTFNADVPDHKHVYYASVVGSARLATATHPVLRACSFVLAQWGGDNDGLVPASSQAWGNVLLRVDACHLSQIGWLASYDPKAIFDPIIRELVREGC